jgi:hypothetical protein
LTDAEVELEEQFGNLLAPGALLREERMRPLLAHAAFDRQAACLHMLSDRDQPLSG